MVEVELNIEASDEMTAAARAANDRPFTTTGVKLRIRKGYASSERVISPASVAYSSGF